MTLAPTDAELCARVQHGDRDAAETIQLRHEGIICELIKQYGLTLTAQTLQAGRIALHLAAKKYKWSKSYNDKGFFGYAKTVIRNALNAARMTADVGGMVVNTGRAGRKAWPKRIRNTWKAEPKSYSNFGDAPDGYLALLPNCSTAPLAALAVLSPLPRVVCRLLSEGIDPVKRLGLYRGELERIRRQAFEEVA